MGTKAKRYEWIEETFARYRYLELGKPDKGLLLKFLMKVSGFSRVQVKRFVRQYFETEHVRRRKPKKRGFIRKYTDGDIRLLAETDELHSTPRGRPQRNFASGRTGYLVKLATLVWRTSS